MFLRVVTDCLVQLSSRLAKRALKAAETNVERYIGRGHPEN